MKKSNNIIKKYFDYLKIKFRFRDKKEKHSTNSNIFYTYEEVKKSIVNFCVSIIGNKVLLLSYDDPFSKFIDWEQGDLSEVEIILEIEDKFSLSLNDKQILAALLDMSFLKVVDYIFHHQNTKKRI